MEKRTLGSILLIIGILIAVFGGLYYGTNIAYNCPSNGCDPHMFDQINAIRYTLTAAGISISVIGIVLILQARTSKWLI